MVQVTILAGNRAGFTVRPTSLVVYPSMRRYFPGRQPVPSPARRSERGSWAVSEGRCVTPLLPYLQSYGCRPAAVFRLPSNLETAGLLLAGLSTAPGIKAPIRQQPNVRVAGLPPAPRRFALCPHPTTRDEVPRCVLRTGMGLLGTPATPDRSLPTLAPGEPGKPYPVAMARATSGESGQAVGGKVRPINRPRQHSPAFS